MAAIHSGISAWRFFASGEPAAQGVLP